MIPTPQTTVTSYDLTPQACVGRLHTILNSGMLTLAARQGGIHPEQSITLADTFLISGDELRAVVAHLAAAYGIPSSTPPGASVPSEPTGTVTTP